MGLHLRGITGSTVEDGLEEKGQLKSSWDENDEIMNLANGGGVCPTKKEEIFVSLELAGPYNDCEG